MNQKLLNIVIIALITNPLASNASLAEFEARGRSMGGVGVVSADYLSAPFYNPALVAIYRRSDNASVLLPTLSASVNFDAIASIQDDLDHISDTLDILSNPSVIIPIDSAQVVGQLEDDIEDINNKSINMDVGGGFAISIPSAIASFNLFTKLQTSTLIDVEIDSFSLGSSFTIDDLHPSIQILTVATSEIGLSIAKFDQFLGNNISLGISPKLQRVSTYNYVQDAASDDGQPSLNTITENASGQTAFNIDAGAVWFYGPVRWGVIGRDLIPHTVEVSPDSITFADGTTRDFIMGEYKFDPTITVSGGLVDDYYTLSADLDLTEHEGFVATKADNIQMLRAGGEVDIMRTLKLRGGMSIDLKNNISTSYTAGVSIPLVVPFLINIVNIDLAVTYRTEKDDSPSQYGLATNFALRF